jgi:hypothetical protein
MRADPYKICLRVTLAGGLLVALGAAAIAWLNNRPVADLLFNIGIGLVAIGVLLGWVVMLVQRLRR